MAKLISVEIFNGKRKMVRKKGRIVETSSKKKQNVGRGRSITIVSGEKTKQVNWLSLALIQRLQQSTHIKQKGELQAKKNKKKRERLPSKW